MHEQLLEELHKPVIKKSKKEKSIRDLTTIFGQQIYLEWNYCLQSINMLNIYHV